MTENVAALVTRLRGVIDTAVSDSLQVEHEFCCTADEQNAASKERVEAESVRDDVIVALEAVTAQRDALAAKLSEISRVWMAADSISEIGFKVATILGSAPSVALDRVKAEAWDEGATAASEGYDLPDAAQIHNPYRKEGNRG